MKNNFWRTINN